MAPGPAVPIWVGVFLFAFAAILDALSSGFYAVLSCLRNDPVLERITLGVEECCTRREGLGLCARLDSLARVLPGVASKRIADVVSYTLDRCTRP